MTTTTTAAAEAASLHGRRVRVAGRVGQLNGWNRETGLVTLWDYAEAAQVTLTLEPGQAPEAAPLTCRACGSEANALFPDATDLESDARVLCPACSRVAARTVKRHTPCDREGCEATHAWRNPRTRRNEYFCGVHHAETEEGVMLNRWLPRVSQPLPGGRRVVCEARGVGSECKGEVKPRGRNAHDLCNAHAGRVSAGDGLADRVIG